MRRAFQFIGQGLAYVLFAAVIGYFSVNPSYSRMEPDKALIKVNFRHAADRKGVDCKRLTPEEIAKLPPHERRPMDCPRERVDILLELDLDGEPLFRGSLPPRGLARDGAASVYQRFPVPAGKYVLTARMRDSNRTSGFDHERTEEIQLVPQQNFVVDFHEELGGFEFR